MTEYDRGFADAREMAAKVCDALVVTASSSGVVRSQSLAAATLAERIRSLTPEE